MKRNRLRSALILAAVVPLTASSARAVTDYFWNQPNGGTGTWDTVS